MNKNLEINFENEILITTSWKATSDSIIDFHFSAYEFFIKLKDKNPSPVKLLIPLEENYKKENIAEKCLKDKFKTYDNNKEDILYGKPNKIICDTIIFVDGILPSKGKIEANKIIILLTNNESWWAKNIRCFTGQILELWYDDTLGFPISSLIFQLQKIKPELEIKLKPFYKGFIPLFDHYNYKPKDKPSKNYTFLVWCPRTYSELYSRDLYLLDRKYDCDILKEIKDTINLYKPKDKNTKLIIAGWNPNYSTDHLIQLNKKPDQKILEDRRASANFAEELSYYFEAEVEVYPECDMPYSNLLAEIDSYIYTPSIKNWETSSRLLFETKYYKKRLCIPNISRLLLEMNPGIKRILEVVYKIK